MKCSRHGIDFTYVTPTGFEPKAARWACTECLEEKKKATAEFFDSITSPRTEDNKLIPEARKATTSLGEVLKSNREIRGWTLQEAGDKLGTSKGQVHELESGVNRNPRLSTVIKLCKVYSIDPRQLLRIAEEDNAEKEYRNEARNHPTSRSRNH